MNDNERIAKWLGATEFHKEMMVGDIVLSPDSGKFFTIGYVTEIRGKKLHTYRPWSPDTDMLLWHDDDGLLTKIGEKVLDCDFLRCLTSILDPTSVTASTMGFMWMGLTATPAQLTAALVAVIKEES